MSRVQSTLSRGVGMKQSEVRSEVGGRVGDNAQSSANTITITTYNPTTSSSTPASPNDYPPITMDFPLKKPTTSASASAATSMSETPSAVTSGQSSKTAYAATFPPTAATTSCNLRTAAATTMSAPSGLDLLFTASQVETSPKADAEGEVAEEAPSTITVFSDGGTAESRYESNRDAEEAFSQNDSNDPENLAAAALKNDVQSFPQILQEILATQEYQPIVHWLSDGFSFIIADKQQFSDVVLPKYFREALFHSFIRKLNRWGFRRIKSRRKGEESSFANVNFVRDKPWLCLKMKCNSKPSYHKGPSTKKNAAESANKLAKAARIVVPVQAPPRSLGAGGMVDASRTFAATCVGEYESLPLPKRPLHTFTTAAVAGSPSSNAFATIHERHFLASIRPEHQERILRERQFLMYQMRQRHQMQAQLHRLHEHRLHEMSLHNEDPANRYAQDSMMAQYTHDMLHRNIYSLHREGERRNWEGAQHMQKWK
eukprot:scaffold27160_cov146-Skeletonema_marinoi.AAC.1